MHNTQEKLISGQVLDNKQKIRPYHILGLLFIFTIILSNLVAIKIAYFFGMHVLSSIFFFPLISIISSIVTEVYGFKSNLRLIWFAGFINFMCGLLLYLAVLMPGAPGIETNIYFDEVMTMTAKIFFACFVSFIIGTYAQTYLLAKLKVKYNGAHSAARIIFSAFIGTIFETIIFVSCVYFEFEEVPTLKLILVSIFIKLFSQIFFYPITSAIIEYIKNTEKIDYYDFKTKFSFF